MDPYLREMLDGSQPQPTQEKLTKKWESEVTSSSPEPATGCFDCNICLDFANDPVVTLCGHLYCWPCIYKWLTHDPSTTPQCPVCKGPLSQTALVPLYGRGGGDEPAGKSSKKKMTLDIPHRPRAFRSNVAQIMNSNTSSQPPSPTRQSQHHHHHHHHLSPPPPPSPQYYQQFYPPHSPSASSPLQFRGSSRVVDGGMAYALLPWMMNLFFGCPESGFYVVDPPYYLTGNDESLRTRRRELQAGRSLNRISVFLLCCLVLCLFLF